MSFENNTGLGVHTWYGPRTDAVRGANKVMTKGALNEVSLEFTGESLANPENVQTGIHIPAGALITEAYVEVDEAFILDVAAVVSVGEKGSAATNGFDITSLLAAEGADIVTTKSGTYDERLTDASEIVVELSGVETGNDLSVGVGKVVVHYYLI
jgi:hypothetical protein